jgi:hypothetical protein
MTAGAIAPFILQYFCGAAARAPLEAAQTAAVTPFTNTVRSDPCPTNVWEFWSRRALVYYNGVMVLARKSARKLLPLVLIAWAAFVALGGAAYLAHQSEEYVTAGSAASAGLGLCALTVAALFCASTPRPRIPRRLNVVSAIVTPLHSASSRAFFRSWVPPPQPTLILLLQTVRT